MTETANSNTTCFDVFLACVSAVAKGMLIRREGRDKEFHFQNWFMRVLDNLRINYDPPARNSYPDFRLVKFPEGYELKGLAYPGREADYDANSRVPSGFHNGRSIFYVFGRYPKDPDTDEYPVLDLVLCHGDFLNAHHEYVHENKHVRGFGSYGDIMIRDRKMYVAPTPFALTNGTEGQMTLILPADWPPDPRLKPVGQLLRVEADKLVVGYSFDLSTNTMTPQYQDNPYKGRKHGFTAYRPRRAVGPRVAMREKPLPLRAGTNDQEE